MRLTYTLYTRGPEVRALKTIRLWRRAHKNEKYATKLFLNLN